MGHNNKSEKKIGYLLETTSRVVKLNFHKTFKELGVDLTPEQWVILESLSRENGQSQADLASASFKNAPTISRIIDLLVDKGWIERKRFKDDRRRYKIYLNPTGRRIVQKVTPAVKQLRKKGWAGLTEQDYSAFNRVLSKIFENYKI